VTAGGSYGGAGGGGTVSGVLSTYANGLEHAEMLPLTSSAVP
jgi:hypothetical protein